MDCLFCKIIEKKIPADIVHEDEQLLVFKDINPQAPTHLLIIPKKHIATINDLEPQDKELTGNIILCAKDMAAKLNLASSGYRVLFNCNSGGGQMVYHIHLHLLGGRQMQWPPG